MTFPQFTHDVLVCFGRGLVANDTVDLTGWTEKLIATLDEDELNPRQYVQEPRERVTIGRGESGDEKPALLLVLLSPNLVDDEKRLTEIERFRASAATDGRTVEHTVIATIMPLPLPPGPNAALDWLLQHGSRAGSEDFYDRDGERPLPLDALKLAPASLAAEIRIKLKTLKRRMPERFASLLPPPPAVVGPTQLLEIDNARLEMEGGAPIPVLPQVYLGSASDSQRWTDVRTALEPIAAVYPAEMSAIDFNLAKQRERDDVRRDFLLRCKGLVLIRASANDRTDRLVSEALDDVRLLRQAVAGWNTPLWVLVDWVADAGPVPQKVAPPRVSALQANWPDGVRKMLKL